MPDSAPVTGPKPRVFLVDDDDSVRLSLQRLFKLAGFTVEAFAQPRDLLAVLPQSGEGCIVTDLKMPEISGLVLQERAYAQGCDFPFVFISGHGEIPDAVAAMKQGAVDFLAKPVNPQMLLAAVSAAIERGRTANAEKRERQAARQLLDQLTPRESQVCELAGRGLLNKQIAAQLGTSEKTVKAQRGSATRKLNVHSTAALVDILRKAGIV